MKRIFSIAFILFLFTAGSMSAANPLDALKGVIGAVTGGSGTADTISAGEWRYTGPAVTFKGDNALKNLGGAAAGATVEAKLKTYYDRAGLQNMTLTVGNDSTFTLKIKKTPLKGTIEYGEAGTCVLHFSGLGKLAGGNFNANWQVVGSSLSLTFDVSKLIDLVGKIASVSGKSSLSALAKLLQSYDGMYAGFRFDKQADATKTEK